MERKPRIRSSSVMEGGLDSESGPEWKWTKVTQGLDCDPGHSAYHSAGHKTGGKEGSDPRPPHRHASFKFVAEIFAAGSCGHSDRFLGEQSGIPNVPQLQARIVNSRPDLDRGLAFFPAKAAQHLRIDRQLTRMPLPVSAQKGQPFGFVRKVRPLRIARLVIDNPPARTLAAGCGIR